MSREGSREGYNYYAKMRKYKGYKIFRINDKLIKWGAIAPNRWMIDMMTLTLKELYILGLKCYDKSIKA